MIKPLVFYLVLCSALSVAADLPGPKTRVLVLTDISSLQSGYKEPDDGQSLIRLMLYSNELHIEGLIATSNLGHGQTTQPALIQAVVSAYDKVRRNLLKHDPRYPETDYLRSVIKSGQPVAGKSVSVHENIGEGKDTEGSAWIIHVIDQPSPGPVWITIWGGATDLAQALWKVRNTRDADAVMRFVKKIRVRAIADQDQAGPWIRENFPRLYYVLQKTGMRGMHRGGDTSLVSTTWVEQHVKTHGALGDLYPVYDGGDIWVKQLGRLRGIKEGDSPAFLSLLPLGLNDGLNPLWLSWGGRFKSDGLANQFSDAIDSVGNFSTDIHPSLASVYRWRSAFQHDFAARMDWCVKDFKGANHAPRPGVKITRTRDSIRVDASRSSDPDSDKLSFNWFIDPYATTGEVPLSLQRSGTLCSIGVKGHRKNGVLHLILAVSDDGQPSLTRYQRVVLSLRE